MNKKLTVLIDINDCGAAAQDPHNNYCTSLLAVGTSLEAVEVANQEVAIIITEVHPITKAVLPAFTSGTGSSFCPTTVAVLFEPILPYLPKVVVMDVALLVIKTDTGAGTDRAIAEDRGNVHPSTTHIELLPHSSLKATKVPLATILCKQLALLIGLADKVHQVEILPVGEL